MIRLTKDDKEFIITFDKFNCINTVECQGVQLSYRNKYVQELMNHLEDLQMRNFPVCGFSRIKNENSF